MSVRILEKRKIAINLRVSGIYIKHAKPMAKSYNITENALKNAIRESVSEIIGRDTIDRLSSLGVKDPSEEYSVNSAELKQKCDAFIDRCNEFYTAFQEFKDYIDGVEGANGALHNIRMRNMFGARNIDDQYFEEDLDALSKSLEKLYAALYDACDCTETFV
jgi:hypothetical protein